MQFSTNRNEMKEHEKAPLGTKHESSMQYDGTMLVLYSLHWLQSLRSLLAVVEVKVVNLLSLLWVLSSMLCCSGWQLSK